MDQLDLLMEWSATSELLKKTKVGVLVNELKKHPNSNESLKEKAKKCVLKWKDDVAIEKKKLNQSQDHDRHTYAKEHAKETLETTEKELNRVKNIVGSIKIDNLSCKQNGSDSNNNLYHNSTPSSSQNTPVTPSQERTVSSDEISYKSCGHKIRDKCIEILYAALAVQSDLDGQIIIRKAMQIEKLVYDKNGDVSASYKSKIRSLQFNLKDKSNSKLRRRVLHGDISPDKFINMTPEELASEEKKQEIEEAQKQNMMDAQVAADQAAETDQFKCGKCKKRKCKYFQMQTRSADEPMTTFVTCLSCDHRWRFC